MFWLISVFQGKIALLFNLKLFISDQFKNKDSWMRINWINFTWQVWKMGKIQQSCKKYLPHNDPISTAGGLMCWLSVSINKSVIVLLRCTVGWPTVQYDYQNTLSLLWSQMISTILNTLLKCLFTVGDIQVQMTELIVYYWQKFTVQI